MKIIYAIGLITLLSATPASAINYKWIDDWHSCKCRYSAIEECGWKSKDLLKNGDLPKWCAKVRRKNIKE